MATHGRMTVAFSTKTKELMDELVPVGRRTDFIDRAVQEALQCLARERLRREMAQCAAEMYDEIIQIEADFHPLEEEVHRQV